MSITIQFCGAAGTVTGSCYLLSHPRGRFLVDCGMFQGAKTLRALNYQPFPFDPGRLDAVLLTHAHTDHAGLIPKLCNRGYRGRVLATPATRDLLTFMLPDSGYIQETEVQRLNRRNAARGLPPVVPIYTREDAEAALEQIDAHPFDEWIPVAEGVRARFWNAGHLLGSASIELEIAEAAGKAPARLLFSGDLGPGEKAFHRDPESPADIDHLVVEATYGDRDRPEPSAEERRAMLRAEVLAAMEAGGNLVIPAFAVERTQELLHDLGLLFDSGALPPIRTFLDSPLAVQATKVFEAHLADLGGSGDLFRRPNVRFTATVEESKALNRIAGGSIIIAASGMCEAGRIRHHLRNNLWRPQATVLFVGFQAGGTLGQVIQSGTADAVRIHGEEVAVKARIRSLDVYSGHADRGDLLAWVGARLPIRRGVFLTHGEPQALASLKQGLEGLGCAPQRLFIPRLDEAMEMTPRGAVRRRLVAPRLPPEAATAPRDWHNDYAALLLDLKHRLDALPDDRARNALIRRLRRDLAAGGAKAQNSAAP